MARPSIPASRRALVASAAPGTKTGSLAGSASIHKPGSRPNPKTDRNQIAKHWQIEAYRHVNICGEARYAAALFASIASRAEIGIADAQTLRSKATWVNEGEEVAVLAELAPTVRERTKLIRDYMLHRVIAGECYLIARDRVETDPEYDLRPRDPVWEIVAVTELQKIGNTWQVRHDNNNFIDLEPGAPVIRMWNPDPENRREAWSPFRSLLPTLREIEFLTAHIFTQVRSRLMSSGVWFLPDNLTFPAPPSTAVEGGAEAIAQMNEAEQFLLSLAASSMEMLDDGEVAFPTVVMGDPASLAAVDQSKLIKFWSEIDDAAMLLRSAAVQRFALGMDLPPEQILGASGLAVTGSGGSAGSVNHWGVWANEEQTISAHVEPALDDFVGVLTSAVLRLAVDNTDKVVAYDTASLRLRQDRSKESMELYDRGELSAKVVLRENGFDPAQDGMTDEEFRKWLLKRIAGGSATPEQMQSALQALTIVLPPLDTAGLISEPARSGTDGIDDRPAPGISDRTGPRSLESHPYEGPPREQHDHSPAPYSAMTAACEGLVLRALEKAGNRLLNDGKRGRDRDRETPAIEAHVVLATETPFRNAEWDFSTIATVLSHVEQPVRQQIALALSAFCSNLYETKAPYTREALIYALRGLS